MYELQEGQWVEVSGAATRVCAWQRLAGFIAGGIAVAVVAAVTVVAAALALLLVPVGVVLAWLASRRRA